MGRGLFITFEGGEGAGKSTQIKRLAEALPDSVITREPGGTDAANALRQVFVDYRGQDWPPKALLMLMFAARCLHTEELIKPALERGQCVISDRYTDSTRAYQGYACGVSLSDIEIIKQQAIGDFEPDLTFILDLDPAIGLARTGKRSSGEDTFESKTLDFHYKLREGYLDIARKNPKRCVVIDASADMDTVTAHILQKVKEHVR